MQSPIDAHYKVTIETDEQRHQRCVDALEAEITADDIADATVVGAGHVDNVSQNYFRQETTEQAQCKYCQQMDLSLPLPHFESEGLENGYRKYHKGAADDANGRSSESHPSSLEDGRVASDVDRVNVDGFFVTFVHTAGKGMKKK